MLLEGMEHHPTIGLQSEMAVVGAVLVPAPALDAVGTGGGHQGGLVGHAGVVQELLERHGGQVVRRVLGEGVEDDGEAVDVSVGVVFMSLAFCVRILFGSSWSCIFCSLLSTLPALSKFRAKDAP
jgi:hypothetical protein